MLINGRPPVVVIIGPTAVGKTEAAIHVANALNGEIISADSRQIYRYMDIGTAKPTVTQREAAVHHLVDVVDPDTRYNVTDFQAHTMQLIDDIAARGRLPMIVGGTGQYITATLEGWQFPGVEENIELRNELESFATEHGWAALLEKLHRLDPITAERIDGRNIRRVVRAIEVCMESGRPFSELQRKKPPNYAVKTFGLTIDPRAGLYDRADRRIDNMLAEGLIDEVQHLHEMGYDWGLSSMSALGYLQIGWYLQGTSTLDDAVHELRRATRLFIRRQYTWFRKYNQDAVWLESTPDVARMMITDITRWMIEQ